MKRIYLDNNATTALDPEVLTAMLQDLGDEPSNPSSFHFFGQRARRLLSNAREEVASFFHFKPSEVIFTSCGTEALNMLLSSMKAEGTHIISSNVEHSALLNPLKILEQRGAHVSYLHAGLHGAVTLQQVEKAISDKTKLIALAAVNNETGVKTDIDAIARLAEAKEIPLIVDGVAWLGKESFSIPSGVSAIAFSGHKIHAPKGIGLCLVRKNFALKPLLLGGDQEFSRRAGTENLAGILGFAKALSLLNRALPEAVDHMLQLRMQFEEALLFRAEPVVINGQGHRVCNTSNLLFPGVDGETLLIQLDQAGIAASHGSACASGALEPSRVLLNMGLSRQLAKSSCRFSLSRKTTREEIESAVEIIVQLVAALRH